MPRTRFSRVRDASKVALTRFPRVYDLARRPYAVARFLARVPHDRDYAVFALFPHKRGSFLDVGANAGMSALSFRIFNKTCPILSVEPNRFHERDLRFVRRFAAPFEFRIVGAGASAGQFVLHVPVYRGVPLTTEASLHLSEVHESGSLRARLGDRMNGGAFEVRAVPVEVQPLDMFNTEPAFVKLDVQGAEYDALLGLRQTIDRCRPVMLIETPDARVLEMLCGMGYTPYRYDQSAKAFEAHAVDQTNVVFVHADDKHLVPIVR